MGAGGGIPDLPCDAPKLSFLGWALWMHKRKRIFFPFPPPRTKINSRKTPWKPWLLCILLQTETLRPLPELFYPVGLSLPAPSSRDLSTELLVGGGNPQGRPGGHAQEGGAPGGESPAVGEGKGT